MSILTLILLRHAKSSWDDSDLPDHDRPLSPRGSKAAQAVGVFLRAEGLAPQLVLSSSALRTRATVALVMAELDEPKPLARYDDALYLASAPKLQDIIQAVNGQPEPRVLMLVGHNPGLHALALELVGNGTRGDIRQLALKFPTGGLAVIDFKLKTWAGVRAGLGNLRLLTSPKRLS